MPRILFVDDNKEYLGIISALLNKVGYDVLTAENGLEAINKFNESCFDAVVTDLIMPGANGYELAKYIRKTSGGDGVPAIICITGTSYDIDRRSFDVFLEKPFSIKKLITHLKDFENKKNSVNARYNNGSFKSGSARRVTLSGCCDF